MKIERDTRRGHRRRPPRPHARRPGRAAGRQPRLRQLGGADEPVAGRGRGARGAPAAPRPRRPRRHVEVPARPTCATSSSARARARRRRASPAARSPRRSCARVGVEVRSHVVQIGAGARAGAATAPLTVADFDGVDDDPVRCLDPEASARDGRSRSTRCARRTSRSAASSRSIAFGLVPGPRLARLLGGAPRRPPRRRDVLDPGVQGRRVRRRLRRRRRARARRRTTRSSTSEERGFYRETNRAGGLEGGMTTGEPLVVRGAMKPLPTLTKPLRSVDIATQRAGPGAARAHRLVHRAGRRRRRRGDGRVRARRRLPRASSAATTSTTSARPSRAYEERIGWQRR